MAGLGYKIFTAGEVLTAANVNGYLMEQAVMVFDDSTARTSAIGTPTEGMLSFLKDTDSTEFYDGSAWQPVSNPGDITAVTAGTALTGGGSTGDVTLDVDLTAVATAGAGTALIADGETLNVDYAPIATALAGTALIADGNTVNVDQTALSLNATQIDYTLTTSTAVAYTLVTADANEYLRFSNPGTVTISTATDFAIGDQATIIADGTALTVTTDGVNIAGAGTAGTAISFNILEQYQAVSVLCVDTDEYRVIGAIEAV